MESHTLIPYYIEAKTKKELVRKMFDNNVKKGGFVKYFDIQKDGSSYIAWYYEEAKNLVFEKESKPTVKKQVTRKTTKKTKKSS